MEVESSALRKSEHSVTEASESLGTRMLKFEGGGEGVRDLRDHKESSIFQKGLCEEKPDLSQLWGRKL